MDREISSIFAEIYKIVVSDSLTSNDVEGWGPTRLLRRADAHATIAALKQEPGNDLVVFGSHVLWNDLLAARLVDELHFMIGAGVLADGTRAFEARPPGTLRLIDARAFEKSNLTLVRYAVTP